LLLINGCNHSKKKVERKMKGGRCEKGDRDKRREEEKGRIRSGGEKEGGRGQTREGVESFEGVGNG